MLELSILGGNEAAFNDILPHCAMDTIPDKNLGKLICQASEAGNVGATKALVCIAGERNDIDSKDLGYVLKHSALDGDAEMVKELLKFPSIRQYADNALGSAAGSGHLECVKELLPFADAMKSHSHPLRYAVSEGRWDVVKELIPHSDPSVDDSLALRAASAHGRADVVKELLPHSNPMAKNSSALYMAAKGASKSEGRDYELEAMFGYGNDYNEIVKMLLPHSETKEWSEDAWSSIKPDLKEYIQTYYERQALNQALPTVQAPQQSHAVTQTRSRGGRL